MIGEWGSRGPGERGGLHSEKRTMLESRGENNRRENIVTGARASITTECNDPAKAAR